VLIGLRYTFEWRGIYLGIGEDGINVVVASTHDGRSTVLRRVVLCRMENSQIYSLGLSISASPQDAFRR